METPKKKLPSFQRIGVVANLEKGPVDSLLGEFVPELIRQGFSVFIDTEMEALAGSIDGVEVGIPDDCDMIAAFGGEIGRAHV